MSTLQVETDRPDNKMVVVVVVVVEGYCIYIYIIVDVPEDAHVLQVLRFPRCFGRFFFLGLPVRDRPTISKPVVASKIHLALL